MKENSLVIEIDDSKQQLVVKIPESEEIMAYQIAMLKNTCNPGIIPLNMWVMDKSAELRYQLTDKVTLKAKLEAGATAQEVLNILEEIVVTINRSAESLLNKHGFLLDMDYIYYAPFFSRTELVYLPLKQSLSPKLLWSDFLGQFINMVRIGTDTQDLLILKNIEDYRHTQGLSTENLYSKIKYWKTLYEKEKYMPHSTEGAGKIYRLSKAAAGSENKQRSLPHFACFNKQLLVRYKKELIVFIFFQGVMFYAVNQFLKNKQDKGLLAYFYVLALLTIVDVIIIKGLSLRQGRQKERESPHLDDSEWEETLKIQLAEERNVLRNEIELMKK